MELNKKSIISVGLVLALGVGFFTLIQSQDSRNGNNRVTFLAKTGLVERSIGLSGTLETNANAQLSFLQPGTVTDILVREGDIVQQGQPLIIIDSRNNQNALREARAQLQEAIASQQDLLLGVGDEVVAFTTTAVENAQNQLAQTISLQEQNVRIARQNLLSSNLEMISTDTETIASPAQVLGTYRCEDEGIYELSVFRSGSDSGFSVRYSGLESGVSVISFTQPVELGSCGLRLQFPSGDYRNTNWTIEIPNTRGSQYLNNVANYETVTKNADIAINNARDALKLAESQRNRDTAPVRAERITQANARIEQIEARIANLESSQSDFTLTAPSEGEIIEILTRIGEVTSMSPVITFLSTSDTFELEVKVPEIDITFLEIGQKAQVVFDARKDTSLNGTLSRISSLPRQIDGVAYFNAVVTIDEPPIWLRSGLNADINIIINEIDTAVKIPTSFITTANNASTVLVKNETGQAEVTPIEIILMGTNGFSAVEGINEDTLILEP